MSCPDPEREEAEIVARLRTLLIEGDALEAWMESPNPAFADKTPHQVIRDGESHKLWDMVFRLESGQPS